MRNKFHNLEVGFISKESHETVQIGFKIPEKNREDFAFNPGQYLTLKATVDGENLRRAYSICSPINKDTISVLVKRLEGGKVSNYLNDSIKPGDRMQVLPPAGNFKISLEEKQKRNTYYLIGAGSGITPLMSMIESILQEDSENVCHLLYGNRDEESIIFKSKLARLELVYPDRFSVEYVLSKPKQEKAFFGKKAPTWVGKIGRINKKRIADFLNQNKSEANRGYYICGPGSMIETSVEALHQLGIEKTLIHREYFTSGDLPSSKEEVIEEQEEIGEATKVIVTLEERNIELSIKGRKDIVQALMDKGEEPPYACLSGSCSSCKAKLIKGKVKMDVNIGLEDGEEEEGYILTCQSHPLTDEVELTYDID